MALSTRYSTTSDVQSHLLGVSTTYTGPLLMPSIVDNLAVSSGSVLQALDRALGGTVTDNSKTVTLSGMTALADSDLTLNAALLQLFNGIGSGSSTGTDKLLFADGRELQMIAPALAGVSLQGVDVGGAMYLRSTMNIAARRAWVDSTVIPTDFNEKAGRDDVVTILKEQGMMPFRIQYSANNIAIDLGNYSVNNGATDVDFIVTQVQARMGPVKLDTWAQFLPWGLEAWAVNPKPGHLLAYGGLPQAMSDDFMTIVPTPIAWFADYAIPLDSKGMNVSQGVFNKDRYWQVGSSARQYQFTITLAVTGYIMDSLKGKTLYAMLQSTAEAPRGILAVSNPVMAGPNNVYLYRQGVSLSSHSLSQETTAFGGRPALATTLTFEYPGVLDVVS
jgi:hypothetical protein